MDDFAHLVDEVAGRTCGLGDVDVRMRPTRSELELLSVVARHERCRQPLGKLVMSAARGAYDEIGVGDVARLERTAQVVCCMTGRKSLEGINHIQPPVALKIQVA